MKKKRFFLVAVAILLIVCLLVPASCIPKGDDASPAPTSTDALQSRIASLESKVSSAQSDASTLKGRVDTLEGQSSTNLQPVIDQLHQKISSLESQISTLQSEVAALEVVKEEEEEEEEKASDVDPEDAVEIDATYPRLVAVPLLNPTETITLQPILVKIKLENQMDVDLEDVELLVRISPSFQGNIQIVSPDGLALTGDIDWMSYGGTEFISLDDIDIDASDRDSYTLTLTIKVTNPSLTDVIPAGYMSLTLKFTCEDYEIVK